MAVLDILLYSSDKSQLLSYQDNDGKMTTEIEFTFTHNCKIVYAIEKWALIEVCDKTHNALKALENKYDIETKRHIRKLHGFISKMHDGEYFYYMNKDEVSIVERKAAIQCINMLKKGIVDVRDIHNKVFKYYSVLNNTFEYISFGFDGIEVWVGEKEKENRTCRFCGGKVPDVTFDKIAHAVQDALGNKLLFCYEECDKCNHGLAPVEDNFRKLMDFRRAMYHISRKGTTKAPTVVGKNFIIKADNNGKPALYLMEEELPKDINKTKRFIHHLELATTMTNEKMYKALCKMVIDMLPSSELSHFENTIRWIRSDKDIVPDALPSILLTVLPTDKVIYKQPVLDILLNKRGHLEHSPFCTAIIWIYDIAYLFCVPLADLDGGMYKYDKDLKLHWKLIHQLLRINGWQQQNTSDDKFSTPWVNWDINPELPNIHILPKSNPIFSECFIREKDIQDAGLPVYDDAGISLCRVEATQFILSYKGIISDSDLRDVTNHIGGPEFTLDPINKQVRVRMWLDAYDTTDKIAYFKIRFGIVLTIDKFWTYIDMPCDKDGTLKSFALHYSLRDHLFIYALAYAEKALGPQRGNTYFAKCTLDKLLYSRRIFTYAYYLVPEGYDQKYKKIMDSWIHNDMDICM